jgi:hypothetical protein
LARTTAMPTTAIASTSTNSATTIVTGLLPARGGIGRAEVMAGHVLVMVNGVSQRLRRIPNAGAQTYPTGPDQDFGASIQAFPPAVTAACTALASRAPQVERGPP